MADVDISTNGDVEQTLQQSDNDVEESMEVQTSSHSCGMIDSESVDSTHKSSIPYDDFKLFVGGLSTETSTLEDYFSEFGTVDSVQCKIDDATKKCRGYAFIIFKERDAVDKVVEKGPHKIDGKLVDSKKAIPHDVHQQMKLRTKKIFVGGVPITMDETTIKNYFSTFGDIDEVALVTEKTEDRRRRGFCFVTFTKEETADRVCESNFHIIDKTKVEVKRATPREQEKRPFHHNGPRRGGGWNQPPYLHPGGRGMSQNFAPYGGAAYYPYFQTPGYPGPGGYMGGYGNYGNYGGYAGYEPYGGGRRDDGAYNSRYGPMRYGHHGHGAFHPYSR